MYRVDVRDRRRGHHRIFAVQKATAPRRDRRPSIRHARRWGQIFASTFAIDAGSRLGGRFWVQPLSSDGSEVERTSLRQMAPGGAHGFRVTTRPPLALREERWCTR